jgi:nitronate monooxygenase
MLVESGAEDIVTSALFTGVSGNYLKPSIRRAGLDPDALPAEAPAMDFGRGSAKPKAWKEIWGAGQGIGAIRAVEPAAAVVARLALEYHEAQARMAAA